MEKNWRKVFSTTKDYNANRIKDLLEINNIKSVCLSEKDSTFVMLGDIDIFVNEKDEGKALNLIKKFQK